jgi:hypothetical protein
VEARWTHDSSLPAHHPHDVEPQGRWALLMSRPGPGPCAEADRAWAGGLYATLRRCGIPHDVLHLASDDDIAPIPLDDVTGYLQAS